MPSHSAVATHNYIVDYLYLTHGTMNTHGFQVFAIWLFLDAKVDVPIIGCYKFASSIIREINDTDSESRCVLQHHQSADHHIPQ